MNSLNQYVITKKTFNPEKLQTAGAAVFDLPEKVLQFGTGVLLRGLPDYFIDKANREGIFNGRIVVVKSTEGAATDFDQQDNLFTHYVSGIENGQPVEEYILNTSISKVLLAQSQWQDILAYAKKPEMQIIISNTTEVGIQFVENEDIFAAPPVSFPGKLVAFLYQRFKTFGGSAESGMVIVPTELIVDNGKKLKEIVIALAEKAQLEVSFIAWLEKHNRFCNSLVDRIVPGKPDAAKKQDIENKIGYKDNLIITSEVYRLWAIEGDSYVREKLSFAKADKGVVIVPDITPYRERKLRLLNGTHTISVPLAFLCGKDTVYEAMQTPLLADFIEKVMKENIAIATPVSSEMAFSFAQEVLDRFRNDSIVHYLINITLQETAKMSTRNGATFVRYYEKTGKVPQYMALGFAAYLYFMKAVKIENGKYYGVRNGTDYPIQDDAAAYFYEKWQTLSPEQLVQEVMSNTNLWATDLTQLGGLSETVELYLLQIMEEGAENVLSEVLQMA